MQSRPLKISRFSDWIYPHRTRTNLVFLQPANVAGKVRKRFGTTKPNCDRSARRGQRDNRINGNEIGIAAFEEQLSSE